MKYSWHVMCCVVNELVQYILIESTSWHVNELEYNTLFHYENDSKSNEEGTLVSSLSITT